MDISIPLLIIFGIRCLHGAERNKVIHIPVYMINIPVTDYCILFAQTPVILTTQTADYETLM